MVKTLVSKGEFARLKARSPACVTKWIKQGKISRAALVGDGNAAKVWVERADSDLAATLDPAQQLIQPVPVSPTVAGAFPHSPIEATQPESLATPAPVSINAQREADLGRRAKADADRAQEDAIAAKRRNAIEDGRWLMADEAAKAWAEELRVYISETETYLATTLARELAETCGLDFKATSVKIRNSYRRFRQAVTEKYEAAEGESAHAGVPEDDDDPDRSAETRAERDRESEPAAAAG